MFYHRPGPSLTSQRVAIWSYGAGMNRTAVDSTTLASAGYDIATNVLELEFRSGALYHYLSVPLSLYRDLLAADSKGRFFNHSIRNCFLQAKVSPPKTI